MPKELAEQRDMAFRAVTLSVNDLKILKGDGEFCADLNLVLIHPCQASTEGEILRTTSSESLCQTSSHTYNYNSFSSCSTLIPRSLHDHLSPASSSSVAISYFRTLYNGL
eukprot:745805-Hanusia_phi.AAC.1